MAVGVNGYIFDAKTRYTDLTYLMSNTWLRKQASVVNLILEIVTCF